MRAAENYTPRPADGASDRQELERRRQAPDVAKEARRRQLEDPRGQADRPRDRAEGSEGDPGASGRAVGRVRGARAPTRPAGWPRFRRSSRGLEKTIDPANPQKSRQALKHLLTTPIVVTPGDDATWLYAFTAAWAGMPAELIDACYPPAVAERL